MHQSFFANFILQATNVHKPGNEAILEVLDSFVFLSTQVNKTRSLLRLHTMKYLSPTSSLCMHPSKKSSPHERVGPGDQGAPFFFYKISSHGTFLFIICDHEIVYAVQHTHAYTFRHSSHSSHQRGACSGMP